jgi:hypothetical protein
LTLIQQFLKIIIIIKFILLKIKVRTAKLQIYEWKRAIGSGAFGPNIAITRSLSSYKHKHSILTGIFPNHNQTNSYQTYDQTNSYQTYDQTNSYQTYDQTNSYPTYDQTNSYQTYDQINSYPTYDRTNLYPYPAIYSNNIIYQ